ncbi:MAG TPA: glycoside hydrolase family 13 protein [Candidatus Coproplasma excrementigallinarum]|uniref:Glycoside hydrolase family 13 protein n=1 Tax=Candidatus Coproplasma excrementigallinarum TaxID=2840747 RepID=A0A9D1SIQ6_9FIRM|nr:glycoside hydrolase family 13 protein [Candidatus Coproplasma excrementigallinarum]
MINRMALFSDETECFRTPYEPVKGDLVTIALRTLADDVNHAYIVLNGIKKEMTKARTDGTFDYYSIKLTCTDDPVSYYFVLYDDDDKVCYNKIGWAENNQSEYNFSFIPGFKVPDWAKGAVVYQIFVDRFCNGNPSNDVENNEYYYTGSHSRKITYWGKYPDKLDVSNFYGGDLQGVLKKLDYLQDLGVEAIYFNPIFVSPSNHKYDTQDYDHIDPHLAVIIEDEPHAMADWEKHNGFARRYIKRVTSQKNLEKSNAFFAELVKEVHRRGMKIIIDGVFNHCGSFNKWMDREGIYLDKEGYEDGAYQSVLSPYRSYFRFNHPNENYSDYEGWWGFETLPKLNYEDSPELVENIMKIGEKWVSPPYNVDGWRLDVAADLGHSPQMNHWFWEKFRKRVRKANPEAFIFAEHYGDPAPWFNGRQWDTVMNYDAFMEPVTWFLTGMEKHSDNRDDRLLGDGIYFFDSMFRNMSRFPRPSLDSALNQLSNHDHSRFLTRTNRTVGRVESMGAEAASYGIDKRVFMLGVTIQMTWPGSPGIYYADEAGQVGWTDPDSRRTYPWGNEDKSLIKFHKKLIAVRKKVHCLKKGSLKKLDAGHGYIVYARFDYEDCAVTIVNMRDEELKLSVPVWEAGVQTGGKMKVEVSSSHEPFEGDEYKVKYGRLLIALPAKSSCVLSCKFGKNGHGNQQISMFLT